MLRYAIGSSLRTAALRATALLGVVAALAAPTPAHAFELDTAGISPDEVVIPCPGSAKILVAVGGTLGTSDITAGHIATRLVITGVTDTLLADMRHPIRASDAAGNYVTRVIEVEVKCNAACKIILADGTAGPSSADIAVEGTSLGFNEGEGKISCKKGAPTVRTMLESGPTVPAGELLEFATVLSAMKKSDARQLRGTATVTLSGFDQPKHVLTVQEFNFRDLRRNLIGGGVIQTGQLPPGIYRLLLIVRNAAGKQIGSSIHTIQVTPPIQ